MMYLNDIKVPGHEQRFAVGFTLASQDASGNSSSTAQMETGDKGKELTVTTFIKFTDAKDLTLLTTLAEAKDASGQRVVYNVNEPTCNAMKVRQVVFNANFNARPDDDLQRWNVSFNLIEYRSVPERKEERQTKKAATVQTATGGSANSTATATAAQGATATPARTATAQTPAPVELSGFEKTLQKLDNWLK